MQVAEHLRKDDIIVISSVLENNNLVGFLLATSDGSITIANIEMIQKLGHSMSYLNARYSDAGKTLDGTTGASLSKYGAITKDFTLARPMSLVVMANLYDVVSKKYVGVLAFNSLGTRYTISYTRLQELLRRYKACNFELTSINGNTVAVMKDGTIFKRQDITLGNKKSKVKTGAAQAVTNIGSDKLPLLENVRSLDLNVSDIGKSTQQKMTLALLNMNKLTPYYYTVLMAIKRIPASVGTMCVTEDTMFYDPKFVAQQAIDQLTFVLIHECLHLAMQHSVRFGNRTNHKLWNIATDLYINQVICNDFNITFRGDAFVYKEGDINSQQYSIRTPDDGIFIETIGKKIDLAIDTPETIYRDLLKENTNQSQSGSGVSDETGADGNGKGRSNSSSSDGSGDSDGGQNNGKNSGKGQSKGNSGNGNNGSSGDSSKGSGGSPNEKIMNNAKSGGSVDGLSDDDFNAVEEVSVIYKGKRLKGKMNVDVMTKRDGEKSEAGEKQNIEESRNLLQRMKTGMKIAKEKGVDLTKNAGAGSGLCSRYIEVGLSANLDWRVLLKNVCKEKPKKTFTLGEPNTDYMNMGMTVASRRRIGKPTHLSRVKFAIDVSGSVSENELNRMLSEVANIFNLFKVDGELIYWSDSVDSVGKFSSLMDMLKVKPLSTGGTDVRGVFEYLNREVACNGQYEFDKAKDIKAIFIITDGCFCDDYADYLKIFGRKVVWLITGVNGNPITFNPPFGRVLSINLPS